MNDSNGVTTPLDPNQDLFREELLPRTQDEKDKLKTIPYQEAIGSLLYAAQATRPDIAFAVGFLSRFSKNFGQSHWTAIKRIFRYLRQTSAMKLVFKKTDNDLTGYSDSDWGGDKKDMKSTTGYVFMFGEGAVSWSCKKQPTVAKSTTEAEYMAMSMATSEAIWLKGLHDELCSKISDSVEISCDNKGAIDLAKNPGFRPKTKHIGIQHHFIRDRIDIGEIKVKAISTNEMIADCLTKALPKDKFQTCVFHMGLYNK